MATPLERLELLYDGEAFQKWQVSNEDSQPHFQGPDSAVALAEGKSSASLEIKTSSSRQAGNFNVPRSDMTRGQNLAGDQPRKEIPSQLRGELGDPGTYCPVLALSKFPYKYMNPKSSASDFVSKKFFANNLFWKNPFNLHYLNLPSAIAEKPLILIPEAEALAFISSIAYQTGLKLSLPIADGGFIITFEKDGSPLPRYLGMSTCREDFNCLEAAVPAAQIDFQEHSDGTIRAKCSQRTFEEWAAKIERAVAATKNKTKASKEKRKFQRVQTKTEWSRQLRRAQRYLGFRGKSVAGTTSAENQQGECSDYLPIQDLELDDSLVHDPNAPASYPFDSDVVLLSIDVEAYEHGTKQITEIGVAKLDTRELSGICPGDGGKNWIDKVKGRHLWIKEYAHLTNKDFVAGCPDRYEACFGTSEIISMRDAVEALELCFKNPNLASSIKDSTLENTTQDEKDKVSLSTQVDSDLGPLKGEVALESERKIVVVGHDISQDITYLKDIGFDLLGKSEVLEILDTCELYRAMRHEENPPSVSTMLYKLGISGWNLHNAGNDAAYTLQALLGIVMRSMAKENGTRADAVALIEQARNQAEERVRDNLEEWEIASKGGDADGGPPQSPSSRTTLKKDKRTRIQAGGII